MSSSSPGPATRTSPAPFAVSEAEEDGVRTFRIRVRPSSRPGLATVETVLGVLTVLGRLRRGVDSGRRSRARVRGRTPCDAGCHRASGTTRRFGAFHRTRPGASSRARRGPCSPSLSSSRSRQPGSYDLGRRIQSLTGGHADQTGAEPGRHGALRTLADREWRDGRATTRVGNLIARKEHRRLIDALKSIIDCGPERLA